MCPTLFRLSFYQFVTTLIMSSCLWERATTQESLWFNYPDCVVACLEFYSSSICDGVDNQCLCNSFEFQGAVAECGRFSCGVGDNDSTIAQIWTSMSYNCREFPDIPIMNEQEFASSAGVAAGGNMPISTTATIIGLSTTFTVYPDDNLITSVASSSGNVMPTTTTTMIAGQPPNFTADPSGSSASVSTSSASGGQVPATTSLNTAAAATTTGGGGGGSGKSIPVSQITGIVIAAVAVIGLLGLFFTCWFQKKTIANQERDFEFQERRVNEGARLLQE